MDPYFELKTIKTSSPLIRTIEKNQSYTQEDRIFSKYGYLHVAVQGDRSKPAVFTFHDIGLNHVSNFQNFFAYYEMQKICENLCIYHINAPGQEEDADSYSGTSIYPTMDELADCLGLIMSYYQVPKFIGFGVGAGANILTRFALKHRDKVEGLFLINSNSYQASWSEWGYQKRNCYYLRSTGMNAYVSSYLIWYHLGRYGEEGNYDVEHVYTNYFNTMVHPSNLALFIESYISRTDLNPSGIKLELKCPVFLMTGYHSPHVETTEVMFGRCYPQSSQMSKIQDCGMVLEEQPGKVADTFKLYLQELGYFFKNLRKQLSSCKKNPDQTSSLATSLESILTLGSEY